jgi:hypothetical protein
LIYIALLIKKKKRKKKRKREETRLPNKKLLKDEGELFEDLGRYHRLVGKLNYLTITRLNISYAVSIVSQFLEAILRTDSLLQDIAHSLAVIL